MLAAETAEDAFALADVELVQAAGLLNRPVEILAVRFDRTRYAGRQKRGEDRYAVVLVRRLADRALLAAPVGGKVAVAQLDLWAGELPKVATLTYRGIQRWRTDL